MSTDNKDNKAKTELPAGLRPGDIPSAQRMFAYICIQESKGNIMAKPEWELMSKILDGAYGPDTNKSAFAKIRCAAKQYVDEKGLASSDGAAPRRARKAGKRKVDEAQDNAVADNGADAATEKPKKARKTSAKKKAAKDESSKASNEDKTDVQVKKEDGTNGVGLSNESLDETEADEAA